MPSCVMNGLIVHIAARLRDKARVSARCSLRTPVQLVYEADMSKLYFELALAGGLIACGSNSSNSTDAPKNIDAKVYLDAPGSGSGSGSGSGALACNGDSAQTPATSVTLTGVIDTVNASFAVVGLGSASVDICTGDCIAANKLGTVTTDGSGNFTAGPFPTNGTAIDAYLQVGSGANVTTLAYAGEPAAADTSFQGIVFPSSFLPLLADIPNGGCTQSAANGLFGVVVTDCNNTKITDTSVAISVEQNGVAVTGTTTVNIGTLLPAFAGFFLVCNVPPGATTVNATYMNKTFLANPVTSIAGEATEAVVRPGY